MSVYFMFQNYILLCLFLSENNKYTVTVAFREVGNKGGIKIPSKQIFQPGKTYKEGVVNCVS